MAPSPDSRTQDFPIGKLSRLTSVNVETIRYYERIRMLPRPRRTASGHRIYGPAEARTLAFIRRGREFGFALAEIRALLALGGPGKASCAEVREIAAHHLERIRAKITDLEKLENLLAGTIAQCSGKRAPECPVIDVLDARAGIS
jgi:MerR family mercuric resistance operon transcriptional regulator